MFFCLKVKIILLKLLEKISPDIGSKSILGAQGQMDDLSLLCSLTKRADQNSGGDECPFEKNEIKNLIFIKD